METASNQKIDGQGQTVCIYNGTEISVKSGGGIERSSILLADFLEKHNFRVVFLSRIRRSPEYPLHEKQHIIPTKPEHLFGDFMREQRVKIFINQNGPTPLPYKGFDFKREKVDFISVLRFKPFFYSKDAPFDRLSRVPLIKLLPEALRKALFLNPLFVHATFCFLRQRLKRNYWKNVRASDRFVLLSESYRSDLQSLLGVRTLPKNICAIPNIAPFEVQNVSFDEKKKELVWVGRVVFRYKRPDFMLHIWQRLQDRFPDWSLRFIGHGEYLPDLKTLAKELGAQRVFFEGYQDPAPYYRSAPIFCMTSTSEGFGLVLVEAQAFGCVPVAFDSFSSVRDIIDDGVNGALVPPFDLDAYAEKLAELMDNPELRVRLARNAQESVARFSPEAIGDKWGKLFKEIGLK